MKPLYDTIYLVSCPCEIRTSDGQLLYLRDCNQNFVVPLLDNIKVVKGKALRLGKSDNYYGVNPPPMPAGWGINIGVGNEPKKASITVFDELKLADMNLDRKIFNDPEVPEGCKAFMMFHEMGHLIYGPDEVACDNFAWENALRAGVSPFLCYVAIRTYMPEHYSNRVVNMGMNLIKSKNLKTDF